MPVINRIAEFADDVKAWRRDLHEHPELLFDVHRTAGIVAAKLRSFGCDEVVEGLGRTGVVGVIRGRQTASGKVIGLRADMDALPILEITGAEHASKTPGKMHACGHDGHTAMLLGAARYLAETRNFDGSAVVIFQPAEEGGGGGREMVNEGMMERFGIAEVFGMHNAPGLPVGAFAIRKGPIMAAADTFDILITGNGSHAAMPHQSIDPVMMGSQIVQALQSIVARNIDPLDSCVISTTTFRAGDAHNVIPQTAHLGGTIRTLKAETRNYAAKRIAEIAEGVAAMHGGKVTVTISEGYPVTVNHDAPTDFAASVARQIAGKERVLDDIQPLMGAEDFSYMLEARPGAFIFIGAGNTAGLHHPAYDFNDDISPLGMSYWAKLVETAMPARG